jgi:hypothetical protein
LTYEKGNKKWVQLVKGHKDPEREKWYSSTLSLTSALERGGWLAPRPGRFTPQKTFGTHFTGGWMNPNAGLVGCGKSRSNRDFDLATRYTPVC